MDEYDAPASPARDIRRRVGRNLPDIIYGANDGIITTFAVVSGVVGGDLSSQVVLILGFANLVADGISMGASNFLSERSRREPVRFERASRKGLATTSGFVLAGIVPLLAYLVPGLDMDRFVLAIMLATITLFSLGAARALFSSLNWLRAGTEMLVVGSMAGAVAYGVGVFGAAIAGQF